MYIYIYATFVIVLWATQPKLVWQIRLRRATAYAKHNYEQGHRRRCRVTAVIDVASLSSMIFTKDKLIQNIIIVTTFPPLVLPQFSVRIAISICSNSCINIVFNMFI